ncbi:hypothetical protein ACFQ6Q_34955 [Streptomyces sp. NPDC056437]|uniref:hypothetical protein n=1 Tax=Streptomyces sp. NPDC056437 TaxID=3345816 RepID=UPI0036D1331E
MQTIASTTVLNFDNYGSYWGAETIANTEALIARERAAGTVIDEWETTDRDGRPLRIVRMADPAFLDTICVIPVSECPDCGAPVASLRWNADEHHAKCPRHDPHF